MTDSFTLERVLCGRRALAQPLPCLTVGQWTKKGAKFLFDLLVACAFPPHTSGSVHCKSLTWHTFGLAATLTSWSLMTSLPWPPPSTRSSNFFLSPQQRYPRTLPELLTAVAEIPRQQPGDAPVHHDACTIQQVTRIELQLAVSWQPHSSSNDLRATP